MKYSLNDFFVGIVDIFVIFLPGGLLLFVLFYDFPDIGNINPLGGDTASWPFFLAVSFILGHFISMIGAAWEDWAWERSGGLKVKKEVSSELRIAATLIVKDVVPAHLVKNVRRWAAVLLRQDEQSRRVLERIDADRRFFRNLRVVLIASAVIFLIDYNGNHTGNLSAGSILFAFLAHLRYLEQDKKFTKSVFESLVVVHPEKTALQPSKGKEIERRFKVVNDEWRGKGSTVEIRQGYLSTDKERVVRVRVEGENAWLTTKGLSASSAQPEYEYPIPVDDANKILANQCIGLIVEKVRHSINVNGLLWIVDEFKGVNEGLIIAEIETEDEKELKKALESKPSWVGEDITEKYEYRNSNLTTKPFSKWTQ